MNQTAMALPHPARIRNLVREGNRRARRMVRLHRQLKQWLNEGSGIPNHADTFDVPGALVKLVETYGVDHVDFALEYALFGNPDANRRRESIRDLNRVLEHYRTKAVR